MAWTAASAAKGAAAVHAKHGKGHLTARMLAADRANLAKGRAKRHSTHRGSHRKGAFKLPHKASKPVSRGNAAARRVIENNYFTLKSKMPLGDRRIAYHKTVKLTTKKLPGLIKNLLKKLVPVVMTAEPSGHIPTDTTLKKFLNLGRVKDFVSNIGVQQNASKRLGKFLKDSQYGKPCSGN